MCEHEQHGFVQRRERMHDELVMLRGNVRWQRNVELQRRERVHERFVQCIDGMREHEQRGFVYGLLSHWNVFRRQLYRWRMSKRASLCLLGSVRLVDGAVRLESVSRTKRVSVLAGLSNWRMFSLGLTGQLDAEMASCGLESEGEAPFWGVEGLRAREAAIPALLVTGSMPRLDGRRFYLYED